VASVKGGAANAGLLLLLQCDFVILDTQGAYSCHSALIASQSLSFEHRLGTKNARRILSDGNVLTGLACQENGAGMMAFKADLVHARARDLALKIAAAPRVALVELKRHMRMHSIVQRRPVPPFILSRSKQNFTTQFITKPFRKDPGRACTRGKAEPHIVTVINTVSAQHHFVAEHT